MSRRERFELIGGWPQINWYIFHIVLILVTAVVTTRLILAAAGVIPTDPITPLSPLGKILLAIVGTLGGLAIICVGGWHVIRELREDIRKWKLDLEVERELAADRELSQT